MPRFDLEYAYAGHHDTIEDVDVQWSEQGYALIGRGVSAQRRVTIETVLPLDVAAASTRAGLTGWGRLTCEDRVLIYGAMRIEHGLPDSTGTPVSVELADDASQDAGRWPTPESVIAVERSPDDVVGTTTVIRDLTWVGQYGFLRHRRVVDVWAEVTRADSEDGYDDIPTMTQGATFPRVYGAPGTADAPGSPAWLVDETSTPKLVIAGHAVGASAVTIWCPKSGALETLVAVPGVPVQTGVVLGLVYSYVTTEDVSTAATAASVSISLAVDRRYYASWTDGEALPGGAGSVLIDVLSASTLRVDWPAWERARPILDRYRLGGYGDEPVTAIDYITSALLPLLPVTIVTGPDGLRPALAPWLDPEPASVWMQVDADEGLTLAGMVSEREASQTAAVVLEHGKRADTGAFSATATETALDRPGGTVSLQTQAVWDPATASMIAADLLRLRSGHPRTARYTVTDVDRYGPGGDRELYVGRRLRLTHGALAWTDAVAAVSEVEIGPDVATVTIDLRDDEARGDRVVG